MLPYSSHVLSFPAESCWHRSIHLANFLKPQNLFWPARGLTTVAGNKHAFAFPYLTALMQAYLSGRKTLMSRWTPVALTCHSIIIAKKEQVIRFVHYGFEHRSLARVRKAFISLRHAFASLLSWVMLRKLWVFVYLMMKIFLGPVYFKPFISLRHRFVICYRSHYKKIRKRYAIQSTRWPLGI